MTDRGQRRPGADGATRLTAALTCAGLRDPVARRLVAAHGGDPGAVLAAVRDAGGASSTGDGAGTPTDPVLAAVPWDPRVVALVEAAVPGTAEPSEARAAREAVVRAMPGVLLWAEADAAADAHLAAVLAAAVAATGVPARRRRRVLVLAAAAVAAVVVAVAAAVVAGRDGGADAAIGPDGRRPIWVAVLEQGADPFQLDPAANEVEEVAGVNTFTDAIECYEGIDVRATSEEDDWFLAIGAVEREVVDRLVGELGRTPLVVQRLVSRCTLPPPF